MEMMNKSLRELMKRFYPYAWTLPSLLVILILSLVPVILLIYISFTSFELGYPWDQKDFIGLGNYLRLFSGKEVEFWPSIRLSVIVLLSTVAGTLLFGLGVATLFNRKIRFEYLFTAMLLMPIAVNPAIAGLMWRLMLSYDFGIINVLVEQIVGYKVVWLGQSFALYAVMIVMIWMRTPLSALMLLAGLQGIALESIEAGKVEGASAIQIFIHIILPQIKTVIIITCLFQAILALQTFGPIFTLTRGGPGIATNILSLFVHRTGFQFNMLAIAATGASILVGITIILSLFMLRLRRVR